MKMRIIFPTIFPTLVVITWTVMCAVAGSITEDKCTQPASCITVQNGENKCLGLQLDYTTISLDLANDSSTFEDIKNNLNAWSGLKGAPRCWEVLQPLLCAVYMPRCRNFSKIDLFTREGCLKTREPCKIVEEYNNGWPWFLDCNQPYFTNYEFCEGEPYTKMRFMSNTTCMYPLVTTSNADSYYEDIIGCGLQCQNPLFTSAEHDAVHTFIAIIGFLCLISTLITTLTFVIDWRTAKRYPAVIIFFINLCFFVGSIGWLAQFAGHNARNDIVCRRDNTVRLSEPQIGANKETSSCTVVFFIVYYFMMAGVTWFVILAYAWHVSFKKVQSGSINDKLKGKIAYFHITAWALPLVCSIIALSLQKIDGDSLSGICFVGYVDNYARGLLVLFPITISLSFGLVFLIQGVIRLYRLRKASSGIQNNKATSKITSTMLRIGMFALLAFIFVFITLVLHIYDFAHKELWRDSFKNYTICRAISKVEDSAEECQIAHRPNLISIYLNIFAYFGAGIMMSSWVWTKASKQTWKRFFRKVFRLPTNKPIKLKNRHRMIAEAFQKKTKKNGRRISLDFHTSHDDPLGMKFDLASVTSQDMSSAWMNALPNLMTRRGGVALPVAGTLRRYSDSDLSSMVASRRASIDSQINEAEKKLKMKLKKREKSNNGGHRSHRGLTRINPADIAAFNARRRGSNLSQKEMEDLKAHLSKQINDDDSMCSDATACNISLDCDEAGPQSRRSSIDTPNLVPVAQLEELTLATYSMFTASALVDNEQSDEEKQQKKPSKKSRTNKSAKTLDRVEMTPSRPTSKMQKPNEGYINGAVDDEDISDVSL